MQDTHSSRRTAHLFFIGVPTMPRHGWLRPDKIAGMLIMRASATMNNGMCHVSIGDGECVLSPGLFWIWRRKYHPQAAYERHPNIIATAVIDLDTPVCVLGRSGWTCVSDVRARLTASGVDMGRCHTICAILRELEGADNASVQYFNGNGGGTRTVARSKHPAPAD